MSTLFDKKSCFHDYSLNLTMILSFQHFSFLCWVLWECYNKAHVPRLRLLWGFLKWLSMEVDLRASLDGTTVETLSIYRLLICRVTALKFIGASWNLRLGRPAGENSRVFFVTFWSTEFVEQFLCLQHVRNDCQQSCLNLFKKQQDWSISHLSVPVDEALKLIYQHIPWSPAHWLHIFF